MNDISQYAAWATWLSDNAPLVILLLTVGFGILAKLSTVVWQQHKDIEKNELARVVDKIEDLVKQINFLFQKQDTTVESLEHLSVRIGALEKRQEKHLTACSAREQLLTTKFETVDDKLKVLHHRCNDLSKKECK